MMNNIKGRVKKIRKIFAEAGLANCVNWADMAVEFLDKYAGTKHEADAIETIKASLEKYEKMLSE